MKRIYGLLSVMVLMLAMVPATASAYEQIENGTSITVSPTTGIYELKATFTGTLEIESNTTAQYAGHTGSTLLYTSPELGEANKVGLRSRSQDSHGWWTYYYDIEEGKTYYFAAYYDPLNPPVTFTFRFEDGKPTPEVANVYPAPNTRNEYMMFTYPEIQLLFNMRGDVRFESVELLYQTEEGTKTAPVDYREIGTIEGMRYDINIREAILSVKSEMLTKTEFSVIINKPTIDGVAVEGRYVNDDGNIQLDYLYVKQTGVTDIRYPDPFLSYWAPGNPEGVIVVEFDGELAPQRQQTNMRVQVFGGVYKDGEDGWPMLPGAKAVVEGNRLTVDLCGVERVPEGKDIDVVTVYINGVLDANLQQIDYNNGNLIAIWYIPFKVVEMASLMYEYSPSKGSLADVDDIELWVESSAFEHVQIDGFKFTTSEEVVEITIDGVTIEEDVLDPGSMYYTIPVPDSVQQSSGSISLAAMLTSLDGFDYVMSATYENEYNPGSSGVTGIDEECGEAEYYNLQGVRIAKPERGVYVKVANGKAVKVVE